MSHHHNPLPRPTYYGQRGDEITILVAVGVAVGAFWAMSPSAPPPAPTPPVAVTATVATTTRAWPTPKPVCWIERRHLPVIVKYVWTPLTASAVKQYKLTGGIDLHMVHEWRSHVEAPEAPLACHFTSTAGVPSWVVVETETLDDIQIILCLEDDDPTTCDRDRNKWHERGGGYDALTRRVHENPATGLPASLPLSDEWRWGYATAAAGFGVQIGHRFTLAPDPVATRWVVRVGQLRSAIGSVPSAALP